MLHRLPLSKTKIHITTPKVIIILPLSVLICSQIVRSAADADSNYHSERQRLLSSPKHSSSYPVLKRLASASGNSQTSSKFSGGGGFLEEGESPGIGEVRLGKHHRYNSDTTVTRGPLYGIGGGGGGGGREEGASRRSSVVKSGSFLRQLGE